MHVLLFQLVRCLLIGMELIPPRFFIEHRNSFIYRENEQVWASFLLEITNSGWDSFIVLDLFDKEVNRKDGTDVISVSNRRINGGGCLL